MTSAPAKDQRTHAIIGAAMEVHQELGCGFLEAVYQEALALEFELRNLPFRREAELPVFYKGKRLAATYKPDFIYCESVVVELKAVARLGGADQAQALNYMKAGGFATGLLINFGARSLEFQRLILTESAKSVESADNPAG